MSGGTLVIAGVAVSVKGVVLGGAMTAAGGAIASRAVFAMGDDWDMYAFYRSAESSNINNIYGSIKNALENIRILDYNTVKFKPNGYQGSLYALE
ncbi:MAG: hypothetical protein FWH04_04475 [Oscillospiraceae bacterium]|nr:hypothetical protein [Oscillospiraceae bacterium]